MLQSQRQRRNNDLQNTTYIYIYIAKYRAARPPLQPAIFTTRPNLHERNHVNKLWLWDDSDVKKISMSMDRVGKLCISPLIHQ
jgi:hypothetical protein